MLLTIWKVVFSKDETDDSIERITLLYMRIVITAVDNFKAKDIC